jgi:hypothetical protein
LTEHARANIVVRAGTKGVIGMRAVALAVTVTFGFGLGACGGDDERNDQARCLYDSPLGAFAATFTDGDPCRRELYATGTGTMKAGTGTGCASGGACVRPESHAAGWVNLANGGGAHGGAAAADIVTCARCHDGAETVCIACHGAGSGRDPHRSDWSGPWGSVTNEACYVCHPGGTDFSKL